MKLSKVQYEVMKRLQEGWAMRTGWVAIGMSARILNTKCLQKNGHGRGGPTYSAFTSATVLSLKKKGLIKIEGTVFVRDRNWILTDKGRNLKLVDPMPS